MGSMKDLLGDTPYPESPGYRDHGTSKAAAISMKESAGALQVKVLAVLRDTPSTVHETAARLHKTVPSIQPRFSELRAMGKIDKTGERRKNESGQSANVWRLTDAGQGT